MDPRKSVRNYLMSLSPLDLHIKLLKYYLGKEGLTTYSKEHKYQTDFDVIQKNHKFLWDEDEEPKTWEENLARKYYDKLFKEYCICDLSLYKEGKVAMRWRTESELISGKGQFICGSKHCSINENLKSWEVNFCYQEQDENKNALVKLRLCAECSIKLRHRYLKENRKRSKHSSKKNKKLKADKDKIELGEGKTDEGNNVESKNEDNKIEHDDDDDDDNNIWKGTNKLIEEKSREDDFEDFLNHLLL